MKLKKADRKQFLKQSAALAGLGVGAIRTEGGQTAAPELPESAPKTLAVTAGVPIFQTAVRWPIKRDWTRPETVFAPSRTSLQDLSGMITPSSLKHHVGECRSGIRQPYLTGMKSFLASRASLTPIRGEIT